MTRVSNRLHGLDIPVPQSGPLRDARRVAQTATILLQFSGRDAAKSGDAASLCATNLHRIAGQYHRASSDSDRKALERQALQIAAYWDLEETKFTSDGLWIMAPGDGNLHLIRRLGK